MQDEMGVLCGAVGFLPAGTSFPTFFDWPVVPCSPVVGAEVRKWADGASVRLSCAAGSAVFSSEGSLSGVVCCLHVCCVSAGDSFVDYFFQLV